MGVRVTDPANIALYDSVTGWAFGTTFPSAEHAEDFLRWLAAEPRGPAFDPEIRVLELFRSGYASHDSWADARCYEDNDLEKLIARWRSERVDDEGELIEPTPEEA
jgi:hypothetical protein